MTYTLQSIEPAPDGWGLRIAVVEKPNWLRRLFGAKERTRLYNVFGLMDAVCRDVATGEILDDLDLEKWLIARVWEYKSPSSGGA